MNRRGFLRSIAKGVLAAVATVYCPRALIGPTEGEAFLRRVAESRAFIDSMNKRMAELMFYGETTFEPSVFVGLEQSYTVRWQQEPGEFYGRSLLPGALSK